MRLLLSVLIVAVSASVAFALPLPTPSILLCDYIGYDFTAPLQRDFTTINQQYVALGDVDNVNPAAIITDPFTNQYTFVLESGTLTAADTIAGIYAKYDYLDMDGSFQIYEDLLSGGTNRDYGVNPPNATAPPTFEDGTVILGGFFTSLSILVDLTNGTASLNGTITFYCGEGWGDLPCYEGWTFAGETMEVGTPDGYIWAIDGLVYVEEVTSTQETSWGGIKSLFQ